MPFTASVWKFVRSQVSRFEPLTLGAIGVIGAAVFVFIKVAEEVLEGDTHAFDERLMLALRSPSDPRDPLGPRWLEEVMRDFTALGGNAVLMTVTLAAVGYLVITRKRSAAILVGGSILSGWALSHLLKLGFDRPRPSLVPHATQVYTQSFPSAHAMMSAMVYLTLGALLARTQADPWARAYMLVIAALLTVIIGISRVYLGVHWPTDVMAGWAGGAAWALLCWLLMIWLQAQDKVEAPGETEDDK